MIKLIKMFAVLLGCMALMPISSGYAADTNRVSMSLIDVDIAEALAMLAKQRRLNILLSDDVEGSLSLNLYDVPVADAVQAIASAAGYAVERRGGAYFVLEHEKVGMYSNGNITQVRSFDIHYADPASLEEMLEPYLSRYGKIKALPERNLILVSDKPEFLSRIALLVRHADARPQQVIIEAQILEISLNEEDSSGINWTKLFEAQDGSGSFGLRGLAGAGSSSSSGFVFDFVNPNIDILLTALQQEGRVRTLSTPKLVALDNQEAEVIIGDRRGYQVTTTINQVTSESIEFLESGVILRVTPHIDAQGRVLMDIHPEVSTGTVDPSGIPSQTTTEVTTSLLVPGGETVFIGGLMKHTSAQSYKRMPVLGRIPLVKTLFSSREETLVNTETIVLITPRVVSESTESWDDEPINRIEALKRQWELETQKLDTLIDDEKNQGILGLQSESQPAAVMEITAEPVAQTEVQTETQIEATQATDLQDLPGHLFTVQLMTMSSKARLNRYLEEQGISDLPTVRIQRGDDVSYALLLGTYNSYAEAEAAARNRPAVLQDKEPWIRRLRTLQAAMLPETRAAKLQPG
jgi:type II secretory pathway component GspD/PulD (secretin)